MSSPCPTYVTMKRRFVVLLGVLLGVPVWNRHRCIVFAYPNCPNLANTHYDTNRYNNPEYDDGSPGEDADFQEGQFYPDPPYVDTWYDGNPLPRPCVDVTSNPRGRYSSNLAPCTIAFHQVSGNKINSAYSLSDACTDANILTEASANHGNSNSSAVLPPEIREYIQEWPDECVGDFRRCYEIPVHERIFFNFVCRQGWQFPEQATHVSVNCTVDKTAKLELVNKNNANDPLVDPYLQAQQKLMKDELHELEIVLFVVLGVIICSCFGCLCATYNLVVRPYQESVLTRSHITETDRLMQASTNSNPQAQIV